MGSTDRGVRVYNVGPPEVFFFLFFGVLMLGGIAVSIWTLVDAIQVPDDSMYRSGNKLVWVLVIILGGIIGSIVYLAIGRPTRRAGVPPRATPPPPPPPSGWGAR